MERSTVIQFSLGSLLLCTFFCIALCNEKTGQHLQDSRLVYQLHSFASGKLVAVYRGGRVHAHATRPSECWDTLSS